MSRLDCERWASLFDRQTACELLSEDESVQQAQHVRSCPACARELGAWQELRALDPGLAPVAQRDLLLEDVVLKKLGKEQAWPSRLVSLPLAVGRRRSVAVVAGLVAAAAIAASALLWLQKKPLPDAGVLQAGVTVGAGVADVAGVARRLGEPIKLGEVVSAAAEPLCLLIEPGINACLAAGSELKIVDTEPAHRRLHLNRGRLVASLSPQPRGTTFSVSTRAGKVTAIGTVFAVEVAKEGDPMLVRVHHGSVVVRNESGQEQILRIHETLATATQVISLSSVEEEARDRALLLHGDVTSVPGAGSAPVAPAAPVELGREVSRVAKDTVAEPLPASSAAALGPAHLLRQAIELRSRSQFSEAARVYRDLQASYPSSPEARAGLVSLGDMQLSRLHDAAAALKSFNVYLTSGDRALEQEAEYGRVRALRALGREKEELTAIKRMLERHPTGMYAEPMRARLSVLETDGG